MRLKIWHKGVKLLMAVDAVVYIGLFLTEKPLKWFKLYFMEFQINRITIVN